MGVGSKQLNSFAKDFYEGENADDLFDWSARQLFYACFGK